MGSAVRQLSRGWPRYLHHTTSDATQPDFVIMVDEGVNLELRGIEVMSKVGDTDMLERDVYSFWLRHG